MDLKLELGGKTYTAPTPMAMHFKGYLKYLRESERAKKTGSDADIDSELTFIASLFANPEITEERLTKELTFAQMMELHNEYLPWLMQFVPGAGKNAKSR